MLELRKIQSPNVVGQDFTALESELVKDISKSVSEKTDNLIKEGLSLKGFCFDSKREIIEFIKNRCGVNNNKGEQTFFVDSIPFLCLHMGTHFSETLSFNEISTSIRYNFL